MDRQRNRNDDLWLSVPGEVARYAASTFDLLAFFNGFSNLIGEMGPFVVSAIVSSGDEVRSVMCHGLSAKISPALTALYEQGHRLDQPMMCREGDSTDYPLWPLFASEGISEFLAWPLASAARQVGEFHIGLKGPSALGLPGDVTMEGIASVVSLAIDRDILYRSRIETVEEVQWQRHLSESLIDGVTSGLLVTDGKGTVLLLNGAGEEILGIAEAKLIGRKIHEVDSRLERFADLGLGGSANESVVTIPFPSGELRRVQISKITRFPFRGRDNLIWSFLDVTGTVGLHSKITEQEARYRNLLEQTPLGVFSCDRDCKLTKANSVLPGFLGLGEQDLDHGTDVTKSRVFKDSGLAEAVKDCIDSGKPLISSHQLRGPGGELTHLTAHLAPLVVEGQSVVGLQAILEDTTEQVRVRHSLVESQGRYRNLFENAPVALLEEDFSEVYEYVLALTDGNITDIREYLLLNPHEAPRIVKLVKVQSANRAACELYRISPDTSCVQLQPATIRLFDSAGRQSFVDEVVNLFEGSLSSEVVEFQRPLVGGKIKVRRTVQVAPGSEQSLSRVLVSVIPID